MSRAPKLPGLGRLPTPIAPELVLTEPGVGGGSKWEVCLLSDLRRRGVPEPSREYEFAWASRRRWKADFAWLDLVPPLLVEIEGGTWMQGGGRHNRPASYALDCLKYNAIAVAGFCLLRFTGPMVESGYAARTIAEYFAVRHRL